MNTIDLGNGVVFWSFLGERKVITKYPDGFEAPATRESNEQNLQEARDQGYEDVWSSLVEHELSHTLITRAIFGRESYVLRHESGAERNRYAIRLHEEALVISFQYYVNTGKIDPVLKHIDERLLAGLKEVLLSYGQV